jgi:hypothetical protein
VRIDSERLLQLYSAVLTGAVAVALLGGAAKPAKPTKFDTIDVQRINVVEPDGKLRLAISNQARFPGILLRGKEHPHTTRQAAGMIFYNNEATELGGLIFGGARSNGKVEQAASLTFDQYEQDQVLQFTHQDNGGRRYQGVFISARPTETLDPNYLRDMPAGPEKDALLKKATDEGKFGQPRVALARFADESSRLVLRDAKGKPRLLLSVTKEGEASIEFRDSEGKVVRKLTPAQ